MAGDPGGYELCGEGDGVSHDILLSVAFQQQGIWKGDSWELVSLAAVGRGEDGWSIPVLQEGGHGGPVGTFLGRMCSHLIKGSSFPGKESPGHKAHTAM